jgi:hypothetical protein
LEAKKTQNLKKKKIYMVNDISIVNKTTWQTCDFPVWERVKHIVPVYNAHPSYKIKNLGILKEKKNIYGE